MGRRARKRRGASAVASAAERSPGAISAASKRAREGAPPAPRLSRSERRNAEARARLEPLVDDERPRAVTIGALVAVALAIANVVSYAAGAKIGGQRPALPGILAFELLMLIMALGMWRRRYWAVLGMQALLALVILVFGILLVIASNVEAVILCLVMVGLAGTLFWFLVKALARIQMPRRPTGLH